MKGVMERMSLDTQTVNTILDKLLELVNLWIQGASLNLQNQSNGMTKMTMYGALASAIATIILAGITFWYAFLTKKIVESNEGLVQQNIMPFLYIKFSMTTIDADGTPFFSFQVFNIGRGPALDIKLETLTEGFKRNMAMMQMLKIDSEFLLRIQPTTKEFAIKTNGIYDLSHLHISLKYKDMGGYYYLVSWSESEGSQVQKLAMKQRFKLPLIRG